MSDFNPIVLFFIAKESLAELFLPVAVGGLLLFFAVIVAAFRATARGRLTRALIYAFAVLVIAAAALAPMMPLWSGVETAAFSNWVDVAFAFAFALAPASALAAIVFIGTGLQRGSH